jgi:hypothetical protein
MSNRTRSWFNRLALLLFALGLGLPTVACVEEDKSLGEEIEDVGEEIGEEIEDAAEEIDGDGS